MKPRDLSYCISKRIVIHTRRGVVEGNGAKEIERYLMDAQNRY